MIDAHVKLAGAPEILLLVQFFTRRRTLQMLEKHFVRLLLFHHFQTVQNLAVRSSVPSPESWLLEAGVLRHIPLARLSRHCERTLGRGPRPRQVDANGLRDSWTKNALLVEVPE